ncbi:MAG TPA: hypothetical protein VMP01_14105 [Pirellulaceae bacterium]|nr:hypothetical protein [Pirellulaceae bacterium]
MSQAIQFTTTVLPGHRIEVASPDLSEGQTVQVIVIPATHKAEQRPGSLLDFLQSLPPGPRSAASWEELDRQFQEERDAWDR